MASIRPLPILTVLVLLGGCLVLPAGADAEPSGPVVCTGRGALRGVRDGAVLAFKGIAYAAPPVGDLRWRPPRPPAPWEGVRDATAFGPSCPQPNRFKWGERVGGPSNEDCLRLNVWTTKASPEARMPVMVWIHGGGHTIGSSSLLAYDGAHLATRGVVVVTINYRLGPFGFLAHPLLDAESPGRPSGNQGLLDQIQALRWVRDEIAAFGGDPTRVTIFGESAGGVSVGCLMVSPPAKGLFHRAIAQSGNPTRILRGPTPQGVQLQEALGIRGQDRALALMRARSAEEILGAAKADPLRGGKGTVKYGPVVDGWVLPDEPHRLFATGKQHDVPFLVGSNADDGGVFELRVPVRTPFAYKAVVRRIYRNDADEVLALFPPGRGKALRAQVRRLLTVSSFVEPARFVAGSMAKVPSKAYLYHFTRVPERAARLGLGAAHGLEIPYVFGTDTRVMGFDAADRALAETMQAIWVHFAKTGDPNGEGLPAWPPYTPETDLHLELGDRVRVDTHLYAKECDLFAKIRAKGR